MIYPQPESWVFSDQSIPEPIRDGSETIAIRSADHLRELLHSYSGKDPIIGQVKSPEGDRMLFGLGGALSGAHYYVSPRIRRKAAMPVNAHADGEHWFTLNGEPFRIRAKELMPVGDAIEIVVHFFSTHKLAEWIEWK